MSMFNDISCDRKGNKEECLANAGVVKVLARKFGVGQWSFIGPGSGGILRSIVHKELGIILRTKCCWNSQKADILYAVQRLLCPGVSSNKSKGHGKLSIHFTADYSTIETIFRIIVFANQLSL